MCTRPPLSTRTRNNWLIMLLLAASGLLTIGSSIYFLFLPDGGLQGGRNPYYGVVIFFTRSTWDLIHTWAGVAMIAVAAIHIPLYWSWIVTMAKRIFKIIIGKCPGMNARGQFNLMVNLVIGISGILAALSGIYFLFFPGSHGASALTPDILFSRAVWDLIHTWAGVVMILAAVIHFSIHWNWIFKVTGRLLPGAHSSQRALHEGNALSHL